MATVPSIAVLGAGSWGTALAILMARNGSGVTLWGRDPAQVEAMVRERHSANYLPGITFPRTLSITDSLSGAVAEADALVVATPSHAFRATLQKIKPLLRPGQRIAWATKGLEPRTRHLLHEVAQEECGDDRPAAVISGPTFALEVAKGLPTAVTVASRARTTADYFAERLHNSTFRAYTSDDVVGVELGGAVKNVLALAAGIADGLGLGANTRAALITRGLAEMIRLGAALGGRRETFMGLAGLGDLVLTCTDNQSRNRRVGLAIGQGIPLEEAVRGVVQEVEGVRSAPEILALARSRDVEMPIVEQVCRVLFDGVTPQVAVEALLMREQKAELAA